MKNEINHSINLISFSPSLFRQFHCTIIGKSELIFRIVKSLLLSARYTSSARLILCASWLQSFSFVSWKGEKGKLFKMKPLVEMKISSYRCCALSHFSRSNEREEELLIVVEINFSGEISL